jgi:hypothetical protein
MALIAIYAVIDIIWIALVCSVGLGLGMAICTLKNCVVVRIRVAGRAHTVSVPVIWREPRVIKRGSSPCRCVVARSASRGENRRRSLMNRIGRAIVIGFVAAITVCRECGVVVIYVAIGTGDLNVEASQGKYRRIVIKLPVGPECGVMTQLTGRGETHLDVVNRSRCRVVILKMAGDACRVRAR